MATMPATNRILVVEDDPAIRTLLTRHFRRGGFEVEYAMDAEEVASDEAYDVVLTDVHLPGQSGIELARRIKQALPEQQFIFMTGDADPELAREAIDSGAAGYLVKPFELFELDAAVRTAARKRVARRAVPVAVRNRIAESTVLSHVHVTMAAPVLVSPAPHERQAIKRRIRLGVAVAGLVAVAWFVGSGIPLILR